MAIERWVTPQNDQEILVNTKILLKKYPDMQFGLNSNFNSIDKNNLEQDYVKNVIKANGYSIYNGSFSLGNINFRLTAGAMNASQLYKLTGNQDSNYGQPHESQELFALTVLSLFGAPSPSGSLPSADTAAAAGFAKVESALAGAVDRFAEMQISFQEKNEQIREEYERSVAQLRLQIEGEKNALESEIAQKRDELNAAKKLIDDRSNTHARRAIRNELKGSVTETLSLPSFAANAEAKRLFVRIVYLGAIGILMLLAFLSIQSLNAAIGKDASGAIWITGIKSSISSVSVIGLILLYL